jgi:hypothetical protein
MAAADRVLVEVALCDRGRAAVLIRSRRRDRTGRIGTIRAAER